jgi:hypothetical protein
MVNAEKSNLTRDAILQRRGKCEKKCLFCGSNESINHLFFKCPLARYIWFQLPIWIWWSLHLQLVEGFWGKKKEVLVVGIAAVIWSIWKTRNLACFEKNCLMNLMLWSLKSVTILTDEVCCRWRRTLKVGRSSMQRCWKELRWKYLGQGEAGFCGRRG